MKEKITNDVITKVADNFKDVIMTGIEECPESFTYTIAVINFIYELKTKRISMDFYKTFDSDIYDEIFKECE